MKIVSWNVNGIRAVYKKGFQEWLQKENADIVCLQETKAFAGQLTTEMRSPFGYYSIWHQGTKPGYSGTVIFSKYRPIAKGNYFNKKFSCFHEQGRVVEACFPGFRLLNLYFPNGNPTSKGEEKLSYKLKFYQCFLEYINNVRDQGEKVIACGDFNVCHREIDIARPKANKKSIGFLPIEREHIDKIIENDYIDVFRHFYPQQKDAYTWWTYRQGARERNVGWRIDYFFVSSNMIDEVADIVHNTEVMGSDHCPVTMFLK